MLFNIVVGTALFGFCLGESSNQAVSSVSFHREDTDPMSYEYNIVHAYNHEKVKKNANHNEIKYYMQPRSHPENYQHMQYAPLNPKDQESHGTLYTTVATPAPIETSSIEAEVTTKINNIEPVEQLTEERYQIEQAIPASNQYVAGHNIVVEPKTNNIIYKHDPKLGYKNNYVFPDRNTYLILKNIQQSYLNGNGQHQDITPMPSYTPVIDANRQKTYYNLLEQYPDKPVRPIQVLSSMENAQIQPVYNPYIKVPRLHINVARASKIAHNQNKAPGTGHLKIFLNNQRQTYVPNINELQNQKQFLYHNNK